MRDVLLNFYVNLELHWLLITILQTDSLRFFFSLSLCAYHL